jgi:hypothetical protein
MMSLLLPGEAFCLWPDGRVFVALIPREAWSYRFPLASPVNFDFSGRMWPEPPEREFVDLTKIETRGALLGYNRAYIPPRWDPEESWIRIFRALAAGASREVPDCVDSVLR